MLKKAGASNQANRMKMIQEGANGLSSCGHCFNRKEAKRGSEDILRIRAKMTVS
jgi:hypothetical protein